MLIEKTTPSPRYRPTALADVSIGYPETTEAALRRPPVKDVVVTSRDDDGRPSLVEFRTSALGRSTHYTLSYDYAAAPSALSWTMVKGDIQRSIEGAYRFQPTADGGTEVRYDLAIELVVPLPGFVKRRAERRILNAIRELKAFAEA